MKFTDIFVRRPVLAICINLLILVAGTKALFNLSIRQYPRSDLAIVTVRTAYVGADADLVRGFISTPLERVIASADGIDYLESSSQQGMSTITAHLRLNFDPNVALTQIQTKVAQVRNTLPPEAESPVIDIETSDNRFASTYLSFYSEILEPNQITDYLTRVVQPQLSAVQGVQKAEILGARTFAMRIWLKPDQLAAHNLTPSDVHNALKANNYLSAIGSTKGSMISVNLVANTDLKSKEEFEQLVIRNQGTTLVRLRDIADVVLGAESYDEDVRFSGQTAVFMGVWVLPNANSLEVIKRVRDVLPDIQKQVPKGMLVGVPYDGTEYIRDAINEVLKTLMETIAIVIVVIFIFIGSFRAVIVPVVAIPLSLIGAAALMLAFGFTLNLLTLLAIVLAVGLVVDDAIVMLENVERHVAEGLDPFKAAIVAARELAGPIIAMTITLAAVYAPIGIQGGLTGTLFREFAFTLAGAVLISGFVALTLSPMMASKIIKQGDSNSPFKNRVEDTFHRLKTSYEKALKRSLSFRPTMLTLAIGLIFFIFPLYMFSTKELAPKEDQGIVFGILQAAPHSTVDQTVTFAKKISKIFESEPEFEQSFQITGPSFGFSGMLLKPWSQRSRNAEQIAEQLWPKVGAVPGIRFIVTTPPPLPGGSDFPVEFIISSTAEPKEIVQFADKIVQRAFESGMFMFADSDLKFDLPQSTINIDHSKVSAMGLSLRDVGNDLTSLLGGNYIDRFNMQGRSYKIIPQVERAQRLNPDQLESVYVRGGGGKPIPLAAIASIENTVQARQLNRFQQINSAKITGANVPGSSVDDALKVLEKAADELLPRGYVVDYAGESRQLRKEGGALVDTLLLALVVIFLVLAAQFESFRDPLIILAGSVPLALAGALLFVFLGFTSINIYSQVGLVTLVGLVAKNGILIVEFANALREEGVEMYEAIVQASATRLRPVLMTSVATVAGHFPLVLASGAGAGCRNSIGWVLVTGMIIGTMFTLFIVPSIYTVIASKKRVRNDQHI